jgi:hypothetical protein
VYKLYRCQGSHIANQKDQVLSSNKGQKGNRRLLWSGAPDCPVCHRTVSGAPPDMSGAPEDSNANSPPSGISRGYSAIIHRTVRCTPDSVRCAKEERPQELASFGNCQRPVRYNSPDCPVQLRSNGYFAPTATCDGIQCAPVRAEGRIAHTGAPDSEQCMSGAPPDIKAGPEVRTPTVDFQRC